MNDYIYGYKSLEKSLSHLSNWSKSEFLNDFNYLNEIVKTKNKKEAVKKYKKFFYKKYSSKPLTKCGHTHKGNRDKKNHRFTCLSCAYKSNDDRIGAMNIYRKGIELISQSDPAVAVEQVSIAKGEVNRPKG